MKTCDNDEKKEEECKRQVSTQENSKLDNNLSSLSTKSTTEVLAHQHYHYDMPRWYRWMILILAILVSFFVGPTYMNPPPMRNMLEGAGANNYLCESDPATTYDSAGVPSCLAKETATANSLSFAVSVFFIFTFIAGMLLDCIGAKLCTLIGMTSMVVGWAVIASSGPQFNGFKIGLFFIAAGTDPSFFGLLSVGNLFPKYTSTVIAVLGMARSISFVIPIIMNSLFSQFGWSIQLIGSVFCCLLAASLLLVAFILPPLPFPHLPHGTDWEWTHSENALSLKTHVKRWPKFSIARFKGSAKNQFSGWVHYAFRWDYLLGLAPIAVITLVRQNYYMQTSHRHFPEAEAFYTITGPLTFIPCPVMGLIADKLAASVCILVLQACGFVSMALSMVPSTAMHYISVVFNWVYVSFVASQFYCYAQAVYPQSQMGKLAGFPLLVAGLTSLCTEPMNNYASTGSKPAFAMDILVVCLGLLSCALAILLFLFIERPMQRRIRAALLHTAHDVENAKSVPSCIGETVNVRVEA